MLCLYQSLFTNTLVEHAYTKYIRCVLVCKYFIATYLNCVRTVLTVKYFTMFSLFYQCRPYISIILWQLLYVCGFAFVYEVCMCVCSYCITFFSKIKCTRLLAANLKHDKNMDQSLVKLIHFLRMIHDQNSWQFSEKSNRTNE